MVYKKIINIILILSFLFAPVLPLAKYFNVSAATYFPVVNVFASQYVTGHNRWYNSIGNFYDTVGDYRTGRSETYLKFDFAGIPSNAIVTSAIVKMYKYANGGGGFWARIARLAQDINTSTGAGLNDFKSRAEFYGSDVFVTAADLDYQELSWNITPLAQSWVNGVYPNYGVAIYSDSAGFDAGASVCSTRFVSWCNGYFPRLELTYIVNQAPNPPNIIKPETGLEFGPRTSGLLDPNSTCAQGSGCNIEFTFSADDPDDTFPLNTNIEIRSSQGGNADQSFAGEGNNTFTKSLADGNWSIRARSNDVYGGVSNYSVTKTFLVDTTAPVTPVIQAEPEYTTELQNEIIVNEAVDNIVGGVEYYFEVSEDNTFTTILQNSGWTSPPITPGSPNTVPYTFGTLTDNTTYYYRVKARDSLWNETGWSNTTESRQDATNPIIQNINTTTQRISPINQDGMNDTTEITFEHNDLYPKEVRIEVKDISNNTIHVETHPSTSSGLPLPTPNTTAIPQTFTWDGSTANLPPCPPPTIIGGGNCIVPDGVYTINITVTDRAGNTTVDNSVTIIVDNTPADISVSTPVTGSWFNTDNITISGQTEADAVLTVVSAQGGSTSGGSNIVLDAVGLFSEVVQIIEGENSFDLTSTDNTGNTNTVNLKYYRENVNPDLVINNPSDNLSQSQNGSVNTSNFNINLDLTDSGFDDGSNNYISGINPSSFYLALERFDNPGTLIELINAGTNVNPSLGNFTTTCAVPGSVGGLGNSGSQSCNLTFNTTNLQPDGEYNIYASVADLSGNSSQLSAVSFELDTHTTNTIITPGDQAQINYSLITITGTAEKGATINISNNHATDSVVFVNVETQDLASLQPPQQNPDRVTISNCRPSPNPTQDGIKEICDYSVADFQLAIDTVNNTNIQNIITINTTDTAGNSDSQNRTVNVNLFNVSLSIETDLEYFSPNGDGVQDGIEFRNILSDGLIDSWELAITLASASPQPSPGIPGEGGPLVVGEGDVVKIFTGVGSLPENLFWDASLDLPPCPPPTIIGGGNCTVPDGSYTYTLKIITTDNIVFETSPKTITAVTSTTDTIVITYPVNNTFTSRGVTNIQGIGPANQTLVICDDTVGLPSDCDYETTIQIDSNGAFSVIHPLVLLPGNNITEHNIYAYAIDQYGNRTVNSNLVKVTYTVNPPFNSVSILPAFTGVNNQADYQIILDKLNNNEEITQADIDSLRSVVFRSDVSLGTERVLISFANHTNLTALPGSTQFNHLGYINGDNLTNLYKIYNNNITSCNTSNCIWDFIYPVPYMTGGGIYEIEFDGKLGTTIQKQTAALTIDANIPTSPLILDIDKFVNPNYTNSNYVDRKFYSNSNNVLIKGIADPNASISVTDQNGNTICSTTSSAIGLWSCTASPQPLPTGQAGSPNGEGVAYSLNTIATLGANSTESVEDATLVIDTIAPTIIKLEDQNPWQKSGSSSEIFIQSNERMIYSYISDNTTNGCINSAYMNNTKKDFILSNDKLTGNTAFTLQGNSIEGKYCLTATIADLAGNTTSQILELYVDNTIPIKPTIDKTNWGVYNGKFARDLVPSFGRLTPEYIINDNSITITGLAEEFSKVELFVDNTLNSGLLLPDRTNQSCTINSSDIIRDGVITKSAYLCRYSFTYNFTAEKGYLFYVKSTDRAGNIAPLSEDEIIYYDKTNPITPETVSVDVIDWVYARNQDVLATNLGTGNSGKLPITNKEKIGIMDYAESRSDTEYWFYSPTGQLLKNNLIQKAGNGVNFRDADLNQGDGVYTFEATSWDAAGNKSGVHKWQVEKDTVRPQAPLAEVSISGGRIFAKISGEEGSSVISNGANVGKTNSSGTQFNLQYAACGQFFHFEFRLQDRAGNISDPTYQSIQSPQCVYNSPEQISGIESPLEGSDKNPHGDNTNRIASPIEIHVNLYKDGNSVTQEVTYSKIPNPVITFIKTQGGNKFTDLYGLAIPKDFPAKLIVNFKEKTGGTCILFICFNETYKTARSESIINLEHVGLGVYKKTQFLFWEGEQEVGWLWNDNRTGKWEKRLNIPSNISIADKLHTKSWVWGSKTIKFYGTNYNISYGNGNKTVSEKSNIVTVPLEDTSQENFTADVVFDRNIGFLGINKWNSLNKETNIRKPTISSIQRSQDNKKIIISGTSEQAASQLKFKVYNYYLDCATCNSKKEIKSASPSYQNFELVLFRENGQKLLSQKVSSSTWKIELDNSAFKLKKDEKIYAQLLVNAKAKSDSLKYWGSSLENNVEFNLENYWTLKSNLITIPSSNLDGISDPIERKITEYEQGFGYSERSTGVIDFCSAKAIKYSKLGDNGESILILSNIDNNVYMITGGIYHTFNSRGGCQKFGLPKMNEGRTGRLNGWYQVFTNADIYWSESNSKSQPGIVEGSIRDYFNSLGGTWSYLGFPEGQQWSETSACSTTGSLQHFSSGKIFSSKFGNVDIDYGGWFNRQNELGIGGAKGTGWPLSKPKHTGLYSKWDFERGEIFWNVSMWEDIRGCDSEFIQLCGVRAKEIGDGIKIYSNGEITVSGDIYHKWMSEGVCEEVGLPTENVVTINKNGVNSYKQSFSKGYDIYNSTFGTFMFSGEYKNKINQIGVQKTGVPKMQNPLKTNDLCGATYDYLDLQNGRIYNFQGSLKYVQGDSAIGSYFFQNGAHDKFGVPKTDENVSLFFYSQEFFNKVNIQLYWPGSAYATKPLDEIYCPGQEPVCGNGVVENKESCDPKDDKRCSLDCKIKCEGLKVWDNEKKECVKEPVCGDGEVDTGETCDDGNIVDGDQCSLDCKNVCVEPEVWSGGKCGVCPEGQVMEGGVCIDQKEFECNQKGLVKYVNPNNSSDVTCAKINYAPYINQWINNAGELYQPADGWMHCSAASSVMALGGFGKLNEKNYDLLRNFINTDSSYTNAGIILDKNQKSCKNIEGAFSYTALENSCNQGVWWRIARFLSQFSIKSSAYAVRADDANLFYSDLKSIIDSGGLSIQGIGKGNIGHIILLIGYTDDDLNGTADRVIVNDSYRNLEEAGDDYNFKGKGAIYRFNTNDLKFYSYYNLSL